MITTAKPEQAQQGASGREVCTPADLALIYEPNVNIVFLKRQLSPCLQHYSRKLASTRSFSTQVVARSTDAVPDALLPTAPDFRRELLRQDIQELSTLYADLTGAREIGLRMRSLHTAMCPRFHTDRVSIRLICAYAGDGTEWLDDEDADRSRLGHRDVSEEVPDPVLRPGARVRRIPTGAIALLKGDSWPDYEQRGVVHRSPAAGPHSARTLLTIDYLSG